GQIRVFGKGVLSSRSGFFPKYDRGVFDNRLVVSAGCSNPVALPRWGNPRELVMIQLNPS
ncbi:MAG: serine/threonine protein phosphatase, partial [Ruminococcus sp.]|nr:serine/threonine protein phosphatase [Ruminococcus sp.]